MLPVAPGYRRPPYTEFLRSPEGRAAFGEEISQRAETHGDQKKAAERAAEKAVEKYGDSDWNAILFQPEQKNDAIEHVAAKTFGRTAGRTLRGEKQAVEWIEAIIELDQKLAAPGLDEATRSAHVAEQTTLAQGVIELLESARLNASSTFGHRIREVLHKWPLKFVSPTFLACWASPPRVPAIDLPPGADPATAEALPSTFWHATDPATRSPAAIYRGETLLSGPVPPLPKLGEVLRLKEVRSADGGGTHPSVDVVDARGAVWKVKFHRPQPLLEEAAAVRLYEMAGKNVLPKFTPPEGALDLDVRAVLAADVHKPRSRVLGVKFRNEYPFEYYVQSLQLESGATLRGGAAIARLREVGADRARLDEVKSVRVKSCDLTLKTDDAKSIGPWDPDALSHQDLRVVRDVAVLSTLLVGRDHKPSNFRLDLEKGENGPELLHLASDVGLTLEPDRPDRLGEKVGVHLGGRWLHNNANMGRLDAFDRMTADDARALLRQIAGYGEEHILAAVAATHASWPVVRFVTDRLVARRDDILSDFQIADEVGRVREPNDHGARDVPDEDFVLTLSVRPGRGGARSGGTTCEPEGTGGGAPSDPFEAAVVKLKRDGHSIEGGRLLKDGAPLGSSIDCMRFFCPTSDPRAR